jgi:hypothetical protein
MRLAAATNSLSQLIGEDGERRPWVVLLDFAHRLAHGKQNIAHGPPDVVEFGADDGIGGLIRGNRQTREATECAA